MDNRKYASLDEVFTELVRCGLPGDYARRAAAEIADHHRDLIDELEAGGMSGPQAVSEASRRLGEPRTLVKKTVREYQRRFWCVRWPLITFLIAPLPVLFATWIVAALSLKYVSVLYFRWNGLEEHDLATLWVKYACMITLLIVIPTLVTYAFAKLATRAALGWSWILLAACLVGVFAGTIKWFRAGEGTLNVIYNTQTHQPQSPQPYSFTIAFPLFDHNWWYWSSLRRWYLSNPLQPLQLLLPLAAAGVVLLRSRQLALRTQRLSIDGS